MLKFLVSGAFKWAIVCENQTSTSRDIWKKYDPYPLFLKIPALCSNVATLCCLHSHVTNVWRHSKFIGNWTAKHLRLQGLNDSFKILTCDESYPVLSRWYSWVPKSSQNHLSSAICLVLELLREHFWPEVLILPRRKLYWPLIMVLHKCNTAYISFYG